MVPKFIDPILLHVGYPKCASSFIQKLLEAAKGDFVFVGKYNSEMYNLFEVSDFDYDPEKVMTQCFSRKRPTFVSLEGLLSEPFETMPGAGVKLRRLKELFPDATIIVIIRNQLNMVSSFIGEIISGGQSGRFTPDEIYNYNIGGKKFDKSYFCYTRSIKFLIKLFGKDKVKVFLFEELIKNPREFLEFVSKTLQVPIIDNGDYAKVREGSSFLLLKYLQITNRWRAGILNPAGGPMGFNLPRFRLLENALHKLGKIIAPHFKPQLISIKNQQKMIEFYGPDNDELSIIIGKDLAAFGYPTACKTKLKAMK